MKKKNNPPKPARRESGRPEAPRRAAKDAVFTACRNRQCKLRAAGCAGFIGCPGYKAEE